MTLLLRSKKFKVITFSFFLIALLSISFSTVYAQTISSNNVVVKSGQTLDKTSFLSGNNIRVDGDINASTFVAGNHIEINGDIDGDLFIAAQSIVINGTVKGSIFTASQNVTINGSVDNNIYSAGANLKVNSETDGSTFLAGDNISIENGAIIEKDTFIGGANIQQYGVINGDLNSSSESLVVDGTIGGNLNYRSKDQAEMTNDSNVIGETHFNRIVSKPTKSIKPLLTLAGIIFSILTGLIVWLVIKLIRRNFWINFAEKISVKPLKTFGFGALAVILTPFIIVFLMITLIGLPLSFILLALYLISLYISKIILSVFIAFWFQKKYNWSNAISFWPFLLSLILLSIIVFIPYLGWIIRFVIVAFGLGSIVLSLKREQQIEVPSNQNLN